MKLIQLNIERNRHLEKVLSFFEREQPDVLCLQEVMERSVPRIAERTDMYFTFVPSARLLGFEEGTDGDLWGIALLSRTPHMVHDAHQYGGSRELPTLDSSDPEHPYSSRRTLLVADVGSEDRRFTIGVTHFTWSSNGENTPLQETDLTELLAVLRQYDELVLCGDFNIPRGTALYRMLAARLLDHVPSDVKTTLDQQLHRVPGLLHVVDYVWSTPHYEVDLHVRPGISDHCALVGEVTRNQQER